MPLTVPCTRCGVAIDLSPELAALAAGSAVSMTHGEGMCPTDEVPDRRWRCEVRVVEVVAGECPAKIDGCEHPHDEHELFAAFATDTTAPTLQKALPLLADGIGKQWEAAIEHAPFADTPVLPDPAPAEERRTAREWEDQAGFVVVDPDGWREPGAPGASDPITLAEFERRAASSTVAPLGSPGAEAGVFRRLPKSDAELDARIDELHGPGAAAVLEQAVADGSVFGG